MRVVSGNFRGRSLKTLKGSATRPTTDRVKEAMMSSIISARGAFDGCVVLDAFAGSGALGIEALSRGAAKVIFCEKSRDAKRVIEENLSSLKINNEFFQVIGTDIFSLPTSAQKYVFDVVFLDPPYAFKARDVLDLMQRFYTSGCLSENTLCCYEHAKTFKVDAFEAFDALKWSVVSSKDYGETSVVLLRKDSR